MRFESWHSFLQVILKLRIWHILLKIFGTCFWLRFGNTDLCTTKSSFHFDFLLSLRLKLKFSCMMELSNFPLDEQVCTMEIASCEFCHNPDMPEISFRVSRRISSQVHCQERNLICFSSLCLYREKEKSRFFHWMQLPQLDCAPFLQAAIKYNQATKNEVYYFGTVGRKILILSAFLVVVEMRGRGCSKGRTEHAFSLPPIPPQGFPNSRLNWRSG